MVLIPRSHLFRISWITSEKLALKKRSLKLSWCVSVLYFGYFNVSKPKNITYHIPGDSYC